MKAIQEMIQKISIKNESKIKRICEPLMLTFGMSGFFMGKTSPDGTFYSISNHLPMHEYYYLNRKFKMSPFHRNPQFVEEGFYTYYQFNEHQFIESIEDVGNKTKVLPIGGICFKQNGNLYRFGYCTNPTISHKKTLSFMQNNLLLLKAFNKHFLEQMGSILKEAENFSIFLPTENCDLYETPSVDQGFSDMPAINQKIDFLKKIGILNQTIKVTKRELEYLHCIGKGMKCAEIAASLFLSVRTVENTIQFLKEKYDCTSKSDLIEIARLIAS